MNSLIEIINNSVVLDSQTKTAIAENFKVEIIKKGEIILKENSVCNKIWFIKSGIIRQFMYIDGKDVSKWFYTSQQWATSHYSYFEQKPSYDYLEIYEDSVVYSVTFDDEKELLNYPLYQKYHVYLLRHYIATINYFMRYYKKMTALDKYEYFLNNHPETIQKVKLKDLASLIGISPETLSRIRASM